MSWGAYVSRCYIYINEWIARVIMIELCHACLQSNWYPITRVRVSIV